jgi:hypothetical protein
MKPRKKFDKKPEGPKTGKISKFKCVNTVAKNLRNLTTEEHEFLIEALDEEGF